MRFSFQRDQDVLLVAVHNDQNGIIADLQARCFDREWGTAEIAKLLDQDNVMCIAVRLVGKPNKPPLAFVLVRHAADEAEILSIGVDPKQRGKGLARKLMDEIVRRLHAERIKSLFLEVDSANKPAVHLYRGLKFETVGERPAYYQNPEGEKSMALVMRLDLV